MALPNKIDQTIPAGGEDRSLGDDRIRALKLAIEDIIGIPDNTNISAALMTVVAAGLKAVNFQDAAEDPAAAGVLQRNSADLKFHDGTNVNTVAMLEKVYPVGSVYISVVDTNPNTLFGFGTWALLGPGRTLVCYDSGQTEFDVLEETGGAKTHTLTTAELAAHNHGVTDPTHVHTTTTKLTSPGSGQGRYPADGADVGYINTSAAATGISINNNGSGAAHNNLQPYIVVSIWKRTA